MKMNKRDQIKEMVESWLEEADMESIFEYAGEQLTNWYNEFSEEKVNNYYADFIDDGDDDEHEYDIGGEG